MRLSVGALAGLAFGTLALGTLSGLAAMAASDSYRALHGPSWAPPPWVFGPVWTGLYLLIGASLWVALRAGVPRSGVVLWAVQLALNLAWTPLFFGLGWRGAALVDIVGLAAAIVATMVKFWRCSPKAGWMLVPYLAWVSFATALNAAYWWMNR